MKHNHSSNDEIIPRSKFVIDLTAKEWTQSLEGSGPSVTRNATKELEVIGSSILNPEEGYSDFVESSTQMITSSDNARGVADASRSAREHFMRTITRLKEESKSSLAYLEILQSNSEYNFTSSGPQRRKTIESEEMNSGDEESPGFQSSYFFPNSLKPITSLSNPNLSSQQLDTPTHPTYQLRLDSESNCSSEQLYSYTPAAHREWIAKRDRGHLEDWGFGGSQVELNILTPLGVRARRMSLSYPDISSSLGKTKEHSQIFRLIERSQSDPFTIHCTDDDISSSYPAMRRIQSSPMINSKSVGTEFNHGCYHKSNSVEKESKLEDKSACVISDIKDPDGISSEDSLEIVELDNSTNPLQQIQEAGIQDQDSLADSLKIEEIEGSEPGLVEDEEDASSVENKELLSGKSFLANERVKKSAKPPVLTENEPESSHAFRQQGIHLVKNMWSDFSFSKYTVPSPKAKKPLRTTVPHPFSVYFKSLRPKKKTPAQLEGEIKRRLESEAEEMECTKKFTARPIPNTTYQYIFPRDDKKGEGSKIELRETIVKPFKFDEREEAKRAQNKAKFLSQQQNLEKYTFKAKPVPKHLFQSRYDDEVAEQDLYREIRKVMRTNQLLSASRLPSSMSVSEHALSYTDGRRRMARKEENSKQAFLTTDHKFKPTVNRRMPDFKRQQELFELKMSEHKEAQRLVRSEFSEQEFDFDGLGGSRIGILFPSRKEVLRSAESFRNSQVRKRTNSPPRADGIYGHAPTKSTRLRQTLVSKRLIEQAQRERDASEREQEQRERALKMKRQVSERVRKYDNREEMTRRAEEKRRHFQETESSRKAQYTEHLRRIKERLDERPLVFERAPLEAARKIASRRFESAVSSPVVREDPDRMSDETFTKSYLVQPDGLSIS